MAALVPVKGRLAMAMAALLLLLCCSLVAAVVDVNVVVCVIADVPFNMRRSSASHDSGGTISEMYIAKNASELIGFDAEFRTRVLTRLPHWIVTLTVIPTYPQLLYETRVGRCDVGFAPVLATSAREACDDSCGQLTTDDDGAAVYPAGCCIDFAKQYVSSDLRFVTRKDMGSARDWSPALAVFLQHTLVW